jgi:hypothetical protein
MEVANGLREVYPDMEMLFILQDRKSRSLFIDREGPLNSITRYIGQSLEEELRDFARQFTFVPSGYYK